MDLLDKYNELLGEKELTPEEKMFQEMYNLFEKELKNAIEDNVYRSVYDEEAIEPAPMHINYGNYYRNVTLTVQPVMPVNYIQMATVIRPP